MTIHIANPKISDDAKEAVCDVLDSGMLADGEVVRSFESEFADYVETDHAVATSSGTTALHAMLAAAGIGEGDVVVTSPFSFVASANAVVHAGGEPAFADVDPATYNLDPQAVRETVKDRDDVAAILAVHLYGLPAAMEELRAIADEHDLLLFEDAAQAHGATYSSNPVGSLADAAAFSFYPTKNMTTAEGGVVTTDDADIAAELRRVVDHGRSGAYTHETVGYNFRMTNVAAAIGREQLSRLPGFVEQRRENAARLTDAFDDYEAIATPIVPDRREHAFHQYTIAVDDRDSVTDALDAASVGYGIYYPETIPGQPAYGERRGWPVAEELTDHVLSLPVHPALARPDVDRIANTVATEVQV